MAEDDDAMAIDHNEPKPNRAQYNEIVHELQIYIQDKVVGPLGYRVGGAAAMQAVLAVLTAPGAHVSAPDTPREAAVLAAAQKADNDDIWWENATRDAPPPPPSLGKHEQPAGAKEPSPTKKADRGVGLTAHSETSDDSAAD